MAEFECGDEGRRCWRCADCKAEQTYWRAQWESARSAGLLEPGTYAQDMHDAGRGHLLTADEKEMVER